MSLAFLAKKSWHTSKVDNVEKVWIAEQKVEKERAKLAELQKQLQEERQIKELRALQGKADTDTSLDWMYQGPTAQQQEIQQSAEDYLLGKIYKSKGVSSVLEEPQALLNVTTKPKWESKTQTKNDIFTRVHEDPLLIIKQQEKKTRESILSNPIKLAKLRQQVESKLLSNEEEKLSHKKERKKEKEEKKESKKHKSHRDSGDYKHSEREDSRDKHRREDRDYSINSKNRTGNSNDSHNEYKRKDSTRGDVVYRVDSSSKRRRDSDSDDASFHQRLSRYDDHPVRSKTSNNTNDDESDDSQDRKESKIKSFGLIKGNKSVNTSESNSQYLGPKRDLIEKKLMKEKEELLAKKRQSERNIEFSEEEKLRRLKEMEDNAMSAEEMRSKRYMHESTTTHSANRQSFGEAKFLNGMRTEVYNTTSLSVEERLKQNRHYSQRGADLDSAGFMSK